MDDLINKIESLKNSDIKKKITKRIKEFKQIDRESSDELFNELCYCILTARSSAKKCYDIWNNIKDDFLTSSSKELAKTLKEYHYALYSKKAKFISSDLTKKDQIKDAVHSLHGEDLRDWLVKNIDGIRYKEASHFLRNIGFDNYAIIDSHILTLLQKYNLIEKPKTITDKKYFEIEHLLKGLSQKLNITLAELDLYLWYMETGKILK
jgi:N-glycosylase/DNA lyase